MEKRRRIALALAVTTLAVAAADHPSANIRILTHDAGDAAPARFQAAIDLGLARASILVTWTARRLAR